MEEEFNKLMEELENFKIEMEDLEDDEDEDSFWNYEEEVE